jgi:ribosome-associated translation inhibitor RaiA
VVVAAKGEIPDRWVGYARTKVLAAISRYAPEPVLFAKVRLAVAADPAVARPAVAQASLDVNGRLVRAQVAAETLRAATDLLHDRLREQLSRIGRNWEARRGAMPVGTQHEWRHQARPTQRPDYYPRPAEERQLVKRKSVTPAAQTPDEAAFDMETMDYDFYLFTDAQTGQDSVIYRSGDDLRLARLDPIPGQGGEMEGPLAVSTHPAPRLTPAEAVERLELTGLRFVFFADVANGRGGILYHRYDGHYGLIAPAS